MPPRVASNALDLARDPLGGRPHVALPESHDAPPARSKVLGDPHVARRVPDDYLDPLRARLRTQLALHRLAPTLQQPAVPEVAIKDDDQPRAREHEVGAADDRFAARTV